MLPAFAAIVMHAIANGSLRTKPASRNAASASGTNATNATSLVITMLEKNVSAESAAISTPPLLHARTNARHIRESTPAWAKPDVATIRENSSPRVRQSIYEAYCASGGTAAQEPAARTRAQASTASRLKKSRMRQAAFFSLPIWSFPSDSQPIGFNTIPDLAANRKFMYVVFELPLQAPRCRPRLQESARLQQFALARAAHLEMPPTAQASSPAQDSRTRQP